MGYNSNDMELVTAVLHRIKEDHLWCNLIAKLLISPERGVAVGHKLLIKAALWLSTAQNVFSRATVFVMPLTFC